MRNLFTPDGRLSGRAIETLAEQLEARSKVNWGVGQDALLSGAGDVIDVPAIVAVAIKPFSVAGASPTAANVWDASQQGLQPGFFAIVPVLPAVKVWLLDFMGLPLTANDLYAAFDSGETRDAIPLGGQANETRPVWYAIGGWAIAAGAQAKCNTDGTITITFTTH